VLTGKTVGELGRRPTMETGVSVPFYVGSPNVRPTTRTYGGELGVQPPQLTQIVNRSIISCLCCLTRERRVFGLSCPCSGLRSGEG
jgi:hypothetical protein